MSDTKHKILVRSSARNDDIQIVYLDGRIIGELTYDAGGWSGMGEARAVLRRLAERMGWVYDEKL